MSRRSVVETMTPEVAVTHCNGSWLTRGTPFHYLDQCSQPVGREFVTFHGDSWALCHHHFSEYIRARVTDPTVRPVADVLISERHDERYRWLMRNGYTCIDDEAIVLAYYLDVAFERQPGHARSCGGDCCRRSDPLGPRVYPG